MAPDDSDAHAYTAETARTCLTACGPVTGEPAMVTYPGHSPSPAETPAQLALRLEYQKELAIFRRLAERRDRKHRERLLKEAMFRAEPASARRPATPLSSSRRRSELAEATRRRGRRDRAG